jgi:hypothetical protein
MPQPKTASEQFEAIFGQLVFSTAAQRTNARTRIQSYADRQRFRGEDIVLVDVPAGKYGAGPSLSVTWRLVNRADVDAVWADLSANAFSFLLDGSQITQTSVVQDPQAGTSTATLIHVRSWPAQPTDF